MSRLLNIIKLMILVATAGVSLALIATGQDTAAVSTTYHQTNLVSDGFVPATFTDANLVNPWGLSRGSTTPWWVSDNGKGVSTLYDGTGTAVPLVVTIPPASGTGPGSPTGTVFAGGKFIFVTLDGTISEWSSGTSAVIKVNHSGTAMYTGCTTFKNGTVMQLYVANSLSGIEAYDLTFNQVSLPPGAFVDPNVPAGYTPYNVQSAGGKPYVTFSQGAAPGAGKGYVDAFDANGTLLLSLVHGNYMNVPWGVVMAPAGFGKFSQRLLVGQLGSGQVTAFNAATGQFLGQIKDSTGHPIANVGLWALAFGNGGSAGPTTTLFFTAGIGFYAHGLFGSILPD